MKALPRRIVTGNDPRGHSTIVLDDCPDAAESGGPDDKRLLREIWATVSRRPEVAPAAASEFRIVDLPAGAAREMHQTDSVDYGIVLAGEVHLVLERGETAVHAGDVIVQRGTAHGWHNRSGNPVRLAFVNLSGQVSDPKRCPDV